ncbi:uncharacterized protein LOC123716265 isoform X1 [Pieris brassicae]|uniref:uncharacterized protein LOC123716265 isoform X1 n=2 Tax=Pieris brassicae TaxID=7116 RepID=UPI001E661DC8|nr:uncharacterized protein LOC123716265 isoform X1 [Pieris brassicae]
MSLRPTPAQVKTVLSFLEQSPEMAWKEMRSENTGFHEIKKMWEELTKIVNSMYGAHKSTSAWMKYWQDKRRNVLVKSRLIKQGKVKLALTSIDKRVIKLHQMRRNHKVIRNKPSNGEDNSVDDAYEVPNDDGIVTNDFEDKSWNLMGTMIDVMGKQAEALTHIGQESLKKSEAMEQIAEASLRQALAVDKLAIIFDGFSGSLYDVRNAIMSIDYTMKRCYPP